MENKDDEPRPDPENTKKLNTVAYTKSPSNLSRSLTIENNSMRLARVESKNYFHYDSEQRMAHLEYESYSI